MGGDQELEERWSTWLLNRNRRGLRGALWIALSLYPLFGVLDYLVAPREWLWLLYGTRAVVTAVTLLMLRVSNSRLFDAHPDGLSAAYLVVASLGISLMTVFMGGLASPYYAGLTLTIVGTGLLFVWPTRVVVPTHATIIASFVIPNLWWNRGPIPFTAVSNQFFLVSTAIIAGTGQILAYRSQREQIVNQLIIERTKKNLEQAHDQLKQLDRFKSEFFANITHELKTPLTMMLAPLELMVDGHVGNVSEAQRSTLASIQRSGVKLLRLIGDLLDLSKLEESRVRLRVDEHDLCAYLRGLVAQAEPLAQRKSLEMHFTSDVERCDVWCDIERIERVFINLLSNATKFTPPRGTVAVHLTDEGSTVRVDFRDTGIGFSPDMAEKVFQRFFQVDMAETRKFGGTGIGLALAKELVQLHGGTIWAESTAGEGATFSVRLVRDRGHFSSEVLDRRGPHVDRAGGNRVADRGLSEWQLNETDKFRLIDIDQATEQRIVDRDVDEQERPYTVLVVEDTPDVIRVIRLALHHDFRVLAAPDGLKGLELAKKHRPTVIVTDLMMPEIDGLELTRRLRADPATRHIPIVMLTARGDVEDRVAGLETGVNAYLAKPFSARELVSVVRSQLESQEATADVLLAHKMDSLETMAGGLAHQIRNPLNYVKNALGSIQRDTEKLVVFARTPSDKGEFDALTARMERMFHTAETGVRRIGATVDLMVRYSREGYTRATQPYDVFAAVRDVVSLVLPTAEHGVTVSTELEGDGHVACVPEEFNQVLTNLVENAFDAVPTDGSGTVEIRGASDGATLVLSVKDNGVGIAPDELPKIFTAFYTTKDVGRGMGMGLTIARRVVSALGGTINVASHVGSGTEVLVKVPRGLRDPRPRGVTENSLLEAVS
jgi:signal transduction histidine kinase